MTVCFNPLKSLMCGQFHVISHFLSLPKPMCQRNERKCENMWHTELKLCLEVCWSNEKQSDCGEDWGQACSIGIFWFCVSSLTTTPQWFCITSNHHLNQIQEMNIVMWEIQANGPQRLRSDFEAFQIDSSWNAQKKMTTTPRMPEQQESSKETEKCPTEWQFQKWHLHLVCDSIAKMLFPDNNWCDILIFGSRHWKLLLFFFSFLFDLPSLPCRANVFWPPHSLDHWKPWCDERWDKLLRLICAVVWCKSARMVMNDAAAWIECAITNWKGSVGDFSKKLISLKIALFILIDSQIFNIFICTEKPPLPSRRFLSVSWHKLHCLPRPCPIFGEWDEKNVFDIFHWELHVVFIFDDWNFPKGLTQSLLKQVQRAQKLVLDWCTKSQWVNGWTKFVVSGLHFSDTNGNGWKQKQNSHQSLSCWFDFVCPKSTTFMWMTLLCSGVKLWMPDLSVEICWWQFPRMSDQLGFSAHRFLNKNPTSFSHGLWWSMEFSSQVFKMWVPKTHHQLEVTVSATKNLFWSLDSPH